MGDKYFRVSAQDNIPRITTGSNRHIHPDSLGTLNIKALISDVPVSASATIFAHSNYHTSPVDSGKS